MGSQIWMSQGSRAKLFAFLGCIICAIRAPFPHSGAAADEGALRGAFEAFSKGGPEGQEDFTKYAVFCSLIDEEVLQALNAGRSIAQVQEILQTLPGYEGPKKSTGVQIGGAVFYRERGSDTPSYWIRKPHPKNDGLLIGIYNYKWYGPGRLSVYGREQGLWVRTSVIDADAPITVYVLTLSGPNLAIATMETLNAADRSEGTLRMWQGRAGKLFSYGPVFERLIDFNVTTTNGVLTVWYTGFLDRMCESVLGTRLEYELRLRVRGGRIDFVKSSLTPWLETLGELYRRVSAGELDTPRLLFDNPSDLRVLQPECGTIAEHEGDLKRGWAWAHIHDRAGALRVEFARRARGVWKITRVTVLK